MSWYRGSIIIDAEGYPRVDYPITFDRLLSKIHQLKEDHVKVVRKIDLNTNKLVEGEFNLLLKRSKILLRQEDYAVSFADVAKKIYGSGYLEKIEESFSGLLSEGLYYSTVIEGDHHLFSPVVLIVCLVTTLKEKYCVNLDKFSTIALLLLDFCLKLATTSYLY